MLDVLKKHAKLHGAAIAIQEIRDDQIKNQWSYFELVERIEALAGWLSANRARSVVISAQNSVDWVLVDLACQANDILFTPMPLFFSTQQVGSVLDAVQPDMFFSDAIINAQRESAVSCPFTRLHAYRREPYQRIDVPQESTKITFTSGSTGAPKGVCLSTENQMNVALALVDVIGIENPKHLCLLPLPTLLENVAGVYSPLLAGGTVILASDGARGFAGSKLVSPEKLLRCISMHQPNTLILVPELLNMLVGACNAGWVPPSSLSFIAVGGSRVAPALLKSARDLALPVYQGYGLSECASVVSLCGQDDDIESCGKVLPHLSVDVRDDEIMIRGNTFLGYLNDRDSWGQNEIYTGDLGRLHGEHLYIEGRRKSVLISSFGRNVAPEWIEAELLSTGMFLQACVFGDAQPFCSAVVVPIKMGIAEKVLLETIHNVNKTLPDYARIYRPIILTSPMTEDAGLYTANGRPKRQAIFDFFLPEISKIYAHAS